MKRRNEKKHVIDFLFPLAVFFVLAASSVAIVVLAFGILQPAGEGLVGFLFGTDGTCLCDGENAPE